MIPLIRTLITYIALNNIVNPLDPNEISTSNGDVHSISNFRDNHNELSISDILPTFSEPIKQEFLFKIEHMSESSEIDSTYDLNKSGTNYVLNFKDGVKCVEVKCRKCQTIWKSQPGSNSSPNFSENSSNLDSGSNNSDLTTYEFLVKTKDDKNTFKEDDYQYAMRKFGTTYALNFENDVTCVEVKYCTISTIWKQDTASYWKRDPRSISYNSKNERTFVRFYGDDFNENSVDQSDIFESTAFPEFELSHCTSESLNSYSSIIQQINQDENTLNKNDIENSVSTDICGVSNQNELDNGTQTLDQNNIYDSSSMLIDISESDVLSGIQTQSDIFH